MWQRRICGAGCGGDRVKLAPVSDAVWSMAGRGVDKVKLAPVSDAVWSMAGRSGDRGQETETVRSIRQTGTVPVLRSSSVMREHCAMWLRCCIPV